MKMNYYQLLITYFTFVSIFFQPLKTEAVHFVIHNLPLHHPIDDPLFLVGSFNAWNPSDIKYKFKIDEQGKWVVSVSDHLKAFEYKVTRGNWEKVEATHDGKPKANRFFIAENESDSVFIDVFGWEDLAGQTTIVLQKLPDSTPYQSKLFLTGDFNDWNPADLQYQFQQKTKNEYRLTLPSTISQFQFKITRGSWSSIECLSNGKYRPNRTYQHVTKGPEKIIIKVDDWEDVFKVDFWDLPQLTQFILFHLFLLSIYIILMHQKEQSFKLTLMLLFTGFLVVLIYSTSLYMPFKNLFGGIHLVHYLAIPIIFIIIGYVQNTVFRDHSLKKNYPVLYLLLFGVIITLGLYLTKEESLLDIFLERKYAQLNLFVKFLFLGTCIISWYQSKEQLQSYAIESLQGNMVKAVKEAFEYYQKFTAVVLMLYTVSILTQAYHVVFSHQKFLLQDLSDHIIWYTTFSLLIFISAWVFKYHSLIKPIEQKSSYKKEEDISNNKEIEEFIEKVKMLFEKDKLYTKHDLTLNQVSNLLDIPSHKLTKLIHQAYKRNFSELVNDYRVQAFTKRVLMGDAEKTTLLSIAFEVGFQSKSTFNRAFKKSKGITPKEFMQKAAIKNILE